MADTHEMMETILRNFQYYGFTTHQYPNAIGLWSGDIKTLIWSYLQTDLDKNWIEIGSFCGGSAVLMCLFKKIFKKAGNVISVDRRPEKIILDNLSHFEDISVLVKALSQDFPKFYRGDPISFAFIDGWHSFKGCLQDFELLKPYLVDGAVICIHDTATPENWTPEYIDKKYQNARLHYDEWMAEKLPNPKTDEQTYNLDEVIAVMIKEHNCEYLKTPVNDPKTYMIPMKYHKVD